MSTNARQRTITIVKVLLTATAFEFFGPILRDFSPSHAFNPTWVGHARVHLVWLLGFMFLSGIVNLYLIWFRRPFDVRNLWLSVAWQGTNLGGFWLSVVLVDVYGGAVTMPDTHVHIFGYDENVFVFIILSILLLAATAMLTRIGTDENDGRAAR
jgi:hypothetical protein